MHPALTPIGTKQEAGCWRDRAQMSPLKGWRMLLHHILKWRSFVASRHVRRVGLHRGRLHVPHRSLYIGATRATDCCSMPGVAFAAAAQTSRHGARVLNHAGPAAAAVIVAALAAANHALGIAALKAQGLSC